ncbi:MAG: metallophosphoesterase family protein [Desulfohalobiaceae bacterium]
MTVEGKFWIIVGDIHEQSANIHFIPEAPKAEAIIVSGDLTNANHWPQARQILEEIQGINPVVYAQIGNMDHPDVEQELQKLGLNLHCQGFMLDMDVGIFGVGHSNHTPFGTPSEVSEERLADWLHQAHAQVSQAKHKVLISHTPPLHTATDRLINGQHVGSKAVRDFLLHNNVEICITGHIHEAVAQDTLHDTLILNPGPLPQGGYALLSLNGKDLKAKIKNIYEHER